MNKAKVILEVSEKSGVNTADCAKVLDAFEEVLAARLKDEKNIGGVFDQIYKVMQFIKSKKDG